MNFYILRSSGRFEPYLKHLEQTIDLSIKKTAGQLVLHSIDIVVYDNPAKVIPGFGFGGRTDNSHTIRISLDPGFPDFDNVINEDVPRSISHELHHSARWNAMGYGTTLLEALISEGLATHFEHDLWGGKLYPWATAVGGVQLKKLAQLAKKEYLAASYDHLKWFFGKGDLPRWAGYALGFDLVAKYLAKHPDESAASLVATPATKIIADF